VPDAVVSGSGAVKHSVGIGDGRAAATDRSRRLARAAASDPGPLLEREGELARIEEALNAARAGHGSLLALSGPAGIGKTTLCTAAVREARRAGMAVLSARGGELEREFSFGLVRQLCEPLLRSAGPADRRRLVTGAARGALLALEGEPDRPPPIGERGFAAIHGLYLLVANASASSPVLIVVDDCHWADPASLRWLVYLADRLGSHRIALLLALRPSEAEDREEPFVRLERLAAAALSPRALTAGAVAQMLSRGLGGTPPPALVDAACAVTGGNPFLIEELIGALVADDVAPDELAARMVRELGPRSVARSVSLRLARLRPAWKLARAVAVLGDGVPLRTAASLAGVAFEAAVAACDRLSAVGIFEPGTPVRFVHPLVRSAVYLDIAPAERALCHGRAAQLLDAHGAELDRVCAHLLLCEPTGSEVVIEQLRAGAEQALARGAPEGAVTYLKRALAEGGPRELRPTLLHALGRAEKLLRDPAGVAHLHEALEIEAEPVRRAQVALDAAELMALGAQWDRALEIADETIAALRSSNGPTSDEARRWVARLESFRTGFAAYDPRRVTELDRRLDDLVALCWAPTPEMRSLAAALAQMLAWRGQETELAGRLLDHSLGEPRFAALIEADSLRVMRSLAAAYLLDRLDLVERLSGELLAESRRRGSLGGTLMALCHRAGLSARRGDLAAAEATLRDVVEPARDHAIGFMLPSALWLAAEALVERPGLADVAELAETTELEPGFAQTTSGTLLHEVRGRVALAGHDLEAARAELEAAAAAYQALRLLSPNAGDWRCALALAIGAVDRERALGLAEEQLRRAEALGLARSRGVALRTLGMLEGGARGLDRLRRSVAVLERSDARLEHGRALVELGAALRRANQRAAAREPLRRGLDLAHRCGAVRLEDRARVELRATGARPRRVSLAGSDALTAAERRVAELAARGLTNSEIAGTLFVTINTVEGHLRHVYQKLSIRSRRQLAQALEVQNTTVPL
jgi:DNA-binding CsgD family transcriptional regulator